MVTIRLLTTDNCKSCKSDFLRSSTWHVNNCPSCFINEIEKGTDLKWISPHDPPMNNMTSYRKPTPDEWYHIIEDKNAKYRMISDRVFSMRPGRFNNIYYSNTLDNCLKWIKKRMKE